MIVFTWMAMMIALFGANIHAEETTSPDSILTFDYIQKIHGTEPQRAMNLVNEIEARKLMPGFRIDILRGMVYSYGLEQYHLALNYTLKAYRSDSIRLYPEERLQSIEMITDLYSSVGNYTESTRFAVEGIELAKQLGNKRLEPSLLFYLGSNKRSMGLKEEGDKYVMQTMQMQEALVGDGKDCNIVDDLIFTYGMTIIYALEDKKYQKAIDLLPRFEKALEQLRDCSDAPDGMYDMRLASTYATYACIFQLNGQPDKGAEFYRRCLATDYGKTNDGILYCFDYLMAAGRYREVLQSIQENKSFWEEDSDTINTLYLECDLLYEAKANAALGNYKAAADAYRRMYVILDSLNIREKQNGVLEFATIYETKEKEEQLAQQAVQLRENRMILLFAVCIIALLGVLLWRNIRHARIVKAKNHALANNINDLLGIRDELYQCKEENIHLKKQLQKAPPHKAQKEADATLKEADATPMEADATPKEETNPNSSFDRNLFDRVERKIINNQLYLQPDFSREELMKIVRIPKNKFSPLFKEYAGTNFSGYINNLRLEYAAKILKENPHLTIDSVAEQCGISSTTSFYRLFVKRFGMTPTEYRSDNK